MSNKSNRSKLIGWIIFLVVISASLYGFYKIRHMGGPQGAMAYVAPKVIATKPITMDLSELYEEVGQTEAINKTDITARVEGELIQRQFVEGSQVQKGDVLFVLEQDKYKAAVDAAEAEVKTAQAAYDNASKYLSRLKKTVAGGVSKADMDAAVSANEQAAANLDAAKANLKVAQLNLDYTTIKSPIEGRIGKANYTKGNIISPSSGTLTSVVQLNPIYAVFAIGEDEALEINDGRRDFSNVDVNITLSNGEKFPYDGQIVFMDNNVNEQSGSVLIRATFPNPENILLPGQFVTLKISPRKKSTKYLVPESAVMQDQGGNYVLSVAEGNLVKRVPVELGRKIGLYRIAEKGITGTETVIYTGMEKAREGKEVAPEIKALEQTTDNGEAK